ncbi:CCA tRNA nucleotidyltransferase [Haloglycomyces albus]|uniref:CCA tRNA nucleotidyltransferase n=1 Tax=Haloglycomyces albus TaxID=526067 RepID=UPI00046D72A5|nr:CCA tRNA nucleotidyltransferase [Haloglycomyces albus]
MSESNHNAITVPPLADDLGELFTAAGHQLYLVGGPVRDAILRRGVHDLDFTTDARPDETLRLLKAACTATWTTGAEFGTIGGVFRGEQVEVTTFRADAYDGITRNPIVAFGDNITDDLKRRDFTINAMAVSLPDHKFVDPHGGITDLVQGTIQTPGSAETSFRDDPLRMLRAARFSSQLGFDIESSTFEAMHNLADELQRITAERIRDEFVKLIATPDPVRGLKALVNTGLADRFLPELSALRMEIDEHAQHKDVYEHSLQVLQNAIELENRYDDTGPDTILRIAALLHDIGKPDTKRVLAGGGVTFYHHDVVGAKMARKRMRALKFPKSEIETVAHLIFLHLRFYGYGQDGWTDSAVRRYVNDAGDDLDRLHLLVRSDVTTRNKRKAARLKADYDSFEERIAEIREKEDLAAVRPDLNGNEIMELLGIGPGPQIGKAWKHLKELRLEHGPMSREEARAHLTEWAEKEGIRPEEH